MVQPSMPSSVWNTSNEKRYQVDEMPSGGPLSPNAAATS
jgi:hypothetical protein